MLPVRILAVCISLASLSACSSMRVSVEPAAVWPFQQMQISSTRGDELIAYYSPPQIEPANLVVVLQDPLCAAADDDQPPAPRVSTSGVLWKQLHADSAFVQFESVGLRMSDPPEAATATDCAGRSAGTIEPEQWSRMIARGVAAIRRHEKLAGLPTIYIGIGAGATAATQLAARDRSTSVLVLLNATDADVIEPARPTTVLIAHAVSDTQAPVAKAQALFSRLIAKGRRVHMLMLYGLDHDLGLSGERPECFDASIRQIVSRTRRMSHDAGRAGPVEESDCERALAEFPEISADN